MSCNVYLYGAGGHAQVIMDIVEACGMRLAGVVDDNAAVDECRGVEVTHAYDGGAPVIISIGANEVRKRIADRLQAVGAAFVKAVHPSAIVSPYASVEEGSVVMQGCILQSGCRIGRHCIVNTGAAVDHECVIGDFAHISPHATLCGNVTVGEGTWIGAGSVVIPGVKIGKWCVIGAGSVVCRDIPDGVMAYGAPCKVIRELEMPK